VPLAAKRGVLHVATVHGEAKLQALANEFRQSQTSFAGGAQALDAVPILKPRYAETCVFEPDAFEIDVDALLQGYLRGMRSRGGEFMADSEVTKIVRSPPGWLVETSKAEVSCRVIVNASGAWAVHVAICAGIRPLGVPPLRRTVIVVDAPAGMSTSDWPLVLDTDETFYFKPMVIASSGHCAMKPPRLRWMLFRTNTTSRRRSIELKR
jgi:D-arginine dehydrogenase